MKLSILIGIFTGLVTQANATCPDFSGTYYLDCNMAPYAIITQKACDTIDLDQSDLLDLFRNIDTKADVMVREIYEEGKLWTRYYYGAHFSKETLELFEITFWARNPQKTVTNTTYRFLPGAPTPTIEITTQLVGTKPSKPMYLKTCP